MSESLVYQSTILYPKPSPYALAISPLVQIKRLFQALYAALLKLMWRELWSGEIPQDEGVNLVAIALFLGLCWLSFTFRQAGPWLVGGCVLFWLVDNTLAQQAFRQGKYRHAVHLHRTAQGNLRWQLHLPGQSPLTMTFTPEQVRHIQVQRRDIRGGAFQERLAKVWQAQLMLYDGSDWIFAESSNLNNVLKAIAELQTLLGDSPVGFQDSYGLGPYALTLISPEQKTVLMAQENTVSYRQTGRKSHLFSRWQWYHSTALIGQIISESGFLVFVLIVMGLMTTIGGFLEQIRQGFTGAPVVVEISLTDWRLPWQDWRVVVPLTLAIAAMIYRGWQLSRVKHCWIDPHFVRASLDNHPLGKLPTADVQAVLTLQAQPNEVLILSPQASLSLPAFPTLDDALRYTCYLTQAIAQYQSSRMFPTEPSSEDTPNFF